MKEQLIGREDIGGVQVWFRTRAGGGLDTNDASVYISRWEVIIRFDTV